MSEYLFDYAIKNIWCNPDVDRQYIVKPYRITQSNGVFNSASVMSKTYSMPTKQERYHVFQVGFLPPGLLGMFSDILDDYTDEWTSVVESINSDQMLMDVYTDKGVQIPRSEVYYMFTNDQNLIFAIKENSRVKINYKTEDIYFRVYSPAYFNTEEGHDGNDLIYAYSVVPTVMNDILVIQNKIAYYKTLSGSLFIYKNGLLVNDITLLNTSLKDAIDIVYDSTVFREVEFKVSDLTVFTSKIDSVYKYLLHYPDTDSTDMIYYHDDIDFYITDGKTSFSGLYYHRNKVGACRMVTHRDYSIMVDNVVNFKSALETILSSGINQSDVTIKLYLRKSSYTRPLVFENQRFQELYKLSDDKVMAALSGVAATVSVWEASNAEASWYSRMTGMQHKSITEDIVEEALGYNAISKIIGDTPQITVTEHSRTMVNVPVGLQNDSTVYEYDSEGLLLRSVEINSATEYTATNSTVKLVEIIAGTGSQYPNILFGTNTINIPENANYRVYVCHAVSGGYDEIWSDITGSDKYTVINNVLTWTAEEEGQYMMVRTDLKFLDYSIGVSANAGVFEFTLSEYQNRGNGNKHRVMCVPMGELDIFLNGYSLIRGLDYVINFPKVVINNREYLTTNPLTTEQKVRIRFTGFCTSDMKLQDNLDTGFIEHGVLSNNNKFDIRDDKVLRIVIAGKVYHRDELIFSELHSGISVTDVKNGRPYSIRDIVVPTRGLTNADTYDLREKSLAIDKEISDYLTLTLPQPERNAPNAITKYYGVFSPFLSKVLTAVLNGSIPSAGYKKDALSTDEVITLCKAYEPWLAFDPSQDANPVDPDYVKIYPYAPNVATSLNYYQYKFIKKVVDTYLNGLVDISNFIIMKTF